MNYDDFIQIRRGRLLGLTKLDDRIRVGLSETSIPALSVDEISILCNGAFMSKEEENNPIKIITGWIEAEKNRIFDGWSFERYYFQNEPEECPPESPPDTSSHDAFIARVMGWNMMEALKVIKIFEEIDALPRTVLRITPEGIHKLMEDSRHQPS